MTASRETFLTAMRQVANSVTVVTTDGPAGPAGATVSAFTSLSADPPSVLVCLRNDSRIAQTVRANGVFCVNVLPEDAAETALRFAGMHDHTQRNRFENQHLRQTSRGAVLDGATCFACDLDNATSHATHAICVGTVRDIINGDIRPLTYLDGAFHALHPEPIPTGDQKCR